MGCLFQWCFLLPVPRPPTHPWVPLGKLFGLLRVRYGGEGGRGRREHVWCTQYPPPPEPPSGRRGILPWHIILWQDHLLWIWHLDHSYPRFWTCWAECPAVHCPALLRSTELLPPLKDSRQTCMQLLLITSCWLPDVEGPLSVISCFANYGGWKTASMEETLIRCKEGVISSFGWGEWGVREKKKSTTNKLSPICAMFYACQLSVAREPQWS